MRLVLAALALGVVVAIVGALVNSNKLNEQIDNQAVALHAGCVRSNERTFQQIDFILTLAKNNVALISPITPASEAAVRHQYAAEYRAKARAIAEANRSVSAFPNSPDPRRLSQVDCDAQYPLP